MKDALAELVQAGKFLCLVSGFFHHFLLDELQEI
jgi:hypothetical protein